jgi:hypothetical protein
MERVIGCNEWEGRKVEGDQGCKIDGILALLSSKLSLTRTWLESTSNFGLSCKFSTSKGSFTIGSMTTFDTQSIYYSKNVQHYRFNRQQEAMSNSKSHKALKVNFLRKSSFVPKIYPRTRLLNGYRELFDNLMFDSKQNVHFYSTLDFFF